MLKRLLFSASACLWTSDDRAQGKSIGERRFGKRPRCVFGSDGLSARAARFVGNALANFPLRACCLADLCVGSRECIRWNCLSRCGIDRIGGRFARRALRQAIFCAVSRRGARIFLSGCRFAFPSDGDDEPPMRTKLPVRLSPAPFAFFFDAWRSVFCRYASAYARILLQAQPGNP